MSGVRDHISERFSVNRLRVELTRGARPGLVILVGLLVAAGAFVYIADNVSPLLLHHDRTVAFAVSDATGVVAGRQEVRFRGIKAGTITGVRMRPGGPVITARIERKYGPIFRDARAALRPTTALQDMYLDILDRGTRAAGGVDASHPLPRGHTTTSVNVTDVLDVFRPGVRAQLRTLLDSLGNGLADRGAALRSAFVQLTPLLQNAGRISRQLALHRALTRRLVHNSALVTEELGRRDGQLRTLVRDGARVTTGLQSRTAALDAALAELPPTLATLDSSFAATRASLGDVDTALARVRPVVDSLPGSLDSLRRLGRAAQPAVVALDPPVHRLRPLAESLVPVARDLDAAMLTARPQVPVFNRTSVDLAHCKKPVQDFFQWNASLTKLNDDGGGLPRGNLELNLTATGSTSDPNIGYPAGCTPGPVVGGRPVIAKDEH